MHSPTTPSTMQPKAEVVKQQLADPEVNVLTGERFDADQRETDLDISSLSSVDTDMLKDAFQFDAASCSST